MKRVHVFPKNTPLCHNTAVVSKPKHFYPQQTDWTCSIACIRTMLSGLIDQVPEEADFIKTYQLQPGPHYSHKLKQLGILNSYDAIYGCDRRDVTFDDILDLAEDGYLIMLESMYNYAHWLVFLGFYPASDGDMENHSMLVFDPYYDKIRLLKVDEFLSMWIDGNHGQTKVEKDFVAVRL